MAAAFSSVANVTPGTGSSFNISITAPSGQPVVVVGISLDSATATVSSVTWSLGSGTPVEVKTSRSGNSFASVWALPAPTVGAGSVNVTLSASVAYKAAAETFTGADQTTPCPTGDAVGPTGNQLTLDIAPINMTAGDAQFGMATSTVAANPTGITPNDRYKSSVSDPNVQVGDRVGTGTLIANWDDTGAAEAGVGVRIAQATGGGGGGFVPDEDYLIFTPSRLP